MSQILILCEGYDDRAFLKCWLLRLGAADLWQEAERRLPLLKKILRDQGVAWNPGDFSVRSQGGSVLTIRPVDGKDNLWMGAQAALDNRLVERLILTCDSDEPAGHPEPTAQRRRQLQRLQTALPCDLVVWHCGDPSGLPGVPEQQTLERLICASIAAGQPETWKQAVEEFLRREPVFGPNHKNFAHAYWAKFFAHDFDDLYSAVWSQDCFPEIGQQLENRLRRNGDWDRIAALVEAS